MQETKSGRAATRAAGGGALAAASLLAAPSLLAAASLLAAGIGAAMSHPPAGPPHQARLADAVVVPAPRPALRASAPAPALALAPVVPDRRLLPAASGGGLWPAVPGGGVLPAVPGKAPAPATGGPAPGSPAAGTAPSPSAAGSGPASWSTSLQQERLAAPIVAAASGRQGSELLLVGADGGVFPVGQAGFYGSLAGRPLAGRVAAVAADPATGGYWMAATDGGVFAFRATYAGGLSRVRLASPVVGMAATPSGRGYWLVSAAGGVFAFGDARYLGGLSRVRLASPVVAMAAAPSGQGYWLASADGGVFGFGHVRYAGNAAGRAAGSPIRALVPTADGEGYWLAGTAGTVFAFGDAPQVGRTATAAALAASALPVVDPHVRKLVDSRLSGYPAGAVGVDLSQYQCRHIPGSPAAIAAVQVTGGAIDNAPNPCYRQEAVWAGPHLSAYIYMDGLSKPAPASSLTGPAGACTLLDVACESFNYGYNWARHWVAYSRSVGVDTKLWWLDVERYSGWRETVSNDLVINGAVLGLGSMGVQAGIYSSAGQWNEITGGLVIPGVPLWVPGAGNRAGPGYSAARFCADPGRFSFGGGVLKMVQFGYQGRFAGSYSGPATPYDLDLACR